MGLPRARLVRSSFSGRPGCLRLPSGRHARAVRPALLDRCGRRWLGSGHEVLQVKYGPHVIAGAIGYIGIAVILCVAAVFGWLGSGQISLAGSDAIERDGLARGQRAPSWSLT